jgi:hypothetical protein
MSLKQSRGLGGNLDVRPLLGNASLLPGEALNEDPEDRIALDEDTDADGDISGDNSENEAGDDDALDDPAFRSTAKSARVSLRSFCDFLAFQLVYPSPD